ncbi:hypothetical protein [Sphingomonas sp. LHG3406-1]|uniref:hypothetical protein n=1 Tax=Sphingomonas sp. LHG3406-1 TaxID=2804617 RepID=UPI002632A0AA|nr:hypothetical protein [Sphingomonas sp. LHG3406-1]
MIALALLATATTAVDLDALGAAVATCDRTVVNPAFSSEAARRSEFMRVTYREQEAIVAQRRENAARRAAMRQQPDVAAAEAALAQAEAAIEERQRALNDQRLLEGLRREAMDSMRHHFLQNCPAGKPKN